MTASRSFRLAVACGALALTGLPQAAAGRTLVFTDSGRCYRLAMEGASGRQLARLARDTSGARSARRLAAALDSLGYFGVRWDTLSRDTIAVTPGSRAVIDTFALQGDTPAGVAALRLPTVPCVYDAGAVGRAARAVLAHLARRGHPFATVAADTSVAAPGHLRVGLTVAADRFCRFGEPLITGQVRTRRRQLLRDVDMRAGEPYDIDKVEQSVQRLGSRDYVLSAQAGAPLIDRRRGEAQEAETLDVITPLAVSDLRGLSLDGAVGFEAAAGGGKGLTGELDFTLLNALGIGERGTVAYRGSEDLQKLNITLAKDWFGGVPLLASTALDVEIERDVSALLAGSLQLLYELAPRWRAGVNLHGHESTLSPPDSVSRTLQFYGAELVVERPAEPPARGRRCRGLRLATGGGYADRGEGGFTRWRADFEASTHVPLGRFQGLRLRLVSDNLFSAETDLAAGECYRLGGHGSLRGYADQQLAYRNAAWTQLEYRAYFSERGAAYIFLDAGLGSTQGFDHGAATTALAGYGVGVQVPVKIGSASIEWARSTEDTRSLGRIHVAIANSLAAQRW